MLLFSLILFSFAVLTSVNADRFLLKLYSSRVQSVNKSEVEECFHFSCWTWNVCQMHRQCLPLLLFPFVNVSTNTLELSKFSKYKIITFHLEIKLHYISISIDGLMMFEIQ